jgi:hypothetical protein
MVQDFSIRENAAMQPQDQSAEYYRLREGHERALALAARTARERSRHLETAQRYRELARSPVEPLAGTES